MTLPTKILMKNKSPLHNYKKKGIPQKLRNAKGFLANADNFDTVKPFSSNRQRKFRYC